jgi:serine protease inhibitor
MIVVLPRKGLGLFKANDKVNIFGMEKIFNELRSATNDYPDEETEVHIPRFEVDTNVNLVEALENVRNLITDLILVIKFCSFFF